MNPNNPLKDVPTFLLLVLTAVLVASRPADAATFNVDMTSDDATATSCDDLTPNDCSLRGAMLAANALSEASIVNVPAGTYVLSQSSTCTYRVKDSTPGISTSSQVSLCLSKQITIQGAGASSTIIDGNQQGYVLFVSADAVAEVRRVTLTNGIGSGILATTERGGGGIHNHGTLTLTETIVSDNTLPTGGVSYGAGILNVGALRLHRSLVANNSAPTGSGGGGIYNNGQTGGVPGGVLTVSDSTISNNTIGQSGGGLLNRLGPATIINSTISGNTTLNGGSGGGIANFGAGGNFTGRLTVINSTISGNTSAVGGGGIYNHQMTRVDLSNVTISNNTSLSSAGGGGGIHNALDGQFTVQNTLIAGNHDLGRMPPAPDCLAGARPSAPLISQGHNLIQDPAHCTIAGGTTGNITGQDPLLGQLASYGGPTQTHLLLAGSPAIDAGNPATPGSGGVSCVALDQRGFARPQAGACDIGAVEHRSGFVVDSVLPTRGGNTGTVMLSIFGNGFADGAIAKLTRAGQPDVIGDPIAVAVGGDVITASFYLAGTATGVWDVVIINPDETAITLTGGFTIEPGSDPKLWVDIGGNPLLRDVRTSRYLIHFGNRGNVDALAVPLTLVIPAGFPWVLRFPITPPPVQPEQVLEDWDRTHIETLPASQTGAVSNLPLLLSIVPAGYSGVLELRLTPRATTPENAEFPFIVAIDPPMVDPTLPAATVSGFVGGARTYVQDAFAETVPEELVPNLEQYVRNQFQSVVAIGRDTLVTNGGTAVPVYSLTQLQTDVAFFALARTLRSPPLTLLDSHTLRWLSIISDRVAPFPLFTWGPSALYAQQQNCPPATGGVLGEGCSSDAKDTVGPPPLDFPPECDPTKIKDQLKTLTGTAKLFLSPPDCKITPDQCKSLPGHHVLQSSNGEFCVPNRPPGKNCPKINVTNPVLPSSGALECGIFPIRRVRSRDPNDKIGTLGATSSHFLIDGVPLHYTINFENMETATAPAQEVVITDQLDVATLDLETFRLGPMAFGKHAVTPAPGVRQFTGGVDLRPEQDLLVLIDAGVDEQSGIVTWRFTSVDPETLQFPEDPLAGFLPPNVNPPEGDGSVAFTVEPMPGLATGSTICNRASIVFDVNDAILTPEWCNAIDYTPPSTAVSALTPTQSAPSFIVDWSGTDTEAGIADFTIFVSENGGPFAPFVSDTTETSANFTGEAGRTYEFYSVARDLVGNEEVAPIQADATTRVAGGPCIGDCNGDDRVTVSEVVTAVRIALELDPVDRCSAADCRNAQTVTIDCLVTAVGAALSGCP